MRRDRVCGLTSIEYLGKRFFSTSVIISMHMCDVILTRRENGLVNNNADGDDDDDDDDNNNNNNSDDDDDSDDNDDNDDDWRWRW